MARLTQTQRNALDTFIETLLSGYIENKQRYTNYTLFADAQQIGIDDLTSSNVSSSYGRVMKKHTEWKVVAEWGRYMIYKPEVVIVSSEIRKDRNLLYFSCDSGYGQLTYDFITKTYNYPLDNTILDNRYIIEDFEYLKDYEWLFNYCTSIREIKNIVRSSILEEEEYKTMPKGLYQYLTSTDSELTCSLLEKYVIESKYGKGSYQLRELIDSDRYFRTLAEIGINNINKMIINDIRNYEYYGRTSIRNALKDLCSVIDSVKGIVAEPIVSQLDFNRGVEYNKDRLVEIRDRERNEKLARQLQTLNFINGYEVDDYVVVVPQTQADKKAEGKMQNNCVGYYYDDSILDGRDYIYFIRKKNNPTKSFITCRYRKGNRQTVEYRLKNNESVRDNYLVGIIEGIDKIIRQQLV